MNYDAVKTEMVKVLLSELDGLWRRSDPEFIERLVGDVLRQRQYVERERNAGTGKEGRYQQNLRHLAATLDAEVHERRIKMAFGCRRLFMKVLSVGVI